MKNKMLIVDDDAINRFVLTRMLQRLGMNEIEYATNGAEALDVLKREGPFSLIFLDLNMPVSDGYDFLHAVNKDEACQAMPIRIFIQSASLEHEYEYHLSKRNIKTSNVLGYFEKPFSTEQIKQGIHLANMAAGNMS